MKKVISMNYGSSTNCMKITSSNSAKIHLYIHL